MNNTTTKRIEENEVIKLKNAVMTFPTLKYFNQSLFIQNVDLNRSFGKKPLSHEDNKFLETELKSCIQVGQSIIGIDIPVLLEPNDKKNGKTIIIVGESPLRVVPKENKEKKIQIGTPYAVHQKFGCPPQCNVYKKIFAALLEIGYTLYLTDAIKIWWDGKGLNSDEVDKDIFSKEIEEIKKNEDVKMIAWGKKAAKLLKSMGYKENETFYRTLHPSRQSWTHWRSQIFNKAIYVKNDIQYIKERYPNKDSKTTEVIVAEEAISDILSCINRK